MDDEFKLYKAYCLENGLKECRLKSLQAYFENKNKKSSFEEFKNDSVEISVVLPMSIYDRLQAIEDYYFWADEKGYDLNCVCTFIEYQKSLPKLKFNKK